MGKLLYVPLFVLSLVYAACLQGREWLYRAGIVATERSPVPVVSVGNISMGGTGKTPLVEKLARELGQRGFRPGIVTRGYGRKRRGVFTVDSTIDTAEEVGDEPLMLAKRTGLPVIVATKRMRAIEMGLREKAIDVAILDDGFQVRDLEKDLEILLLNAAQAASAPRLFPLGPYREPLVMMKKADILLLNKGEPGTAFRAATAGIPCFRMAYQPLHLWNVRRSGALPYGFLKGKKVVAFSAVGDNESFFRLLADLGADLTRMVAFPDHYRYRSGDLEGLASSAGDLPLVTTEKDGVKLAGLAAPENLFYLAVDVVIEEEEEFMKLVLSRLKEGKWREESLYSTRP